MRVCVITAALNEAQAIDDLLTALATQSRLPDEVIVADGGSADGTREQCAMRAKTLPFPITVLTIPGKIAKGRNSAISQTQAQVIAVTDADCVPGANWLRDLTDPIERGEADAVAGGYYADPKTPLERAIATFTWVPLTDGSRRFLPSHRSVAYLRGVWHALGGYNEHIDSGEDTSFDLQVERRFRWKSAPSAQVAWSPRKTIKKALWQQVFYGAGDGQAHIQLRYHAAVTAFVAAEFTLALCQNAVARTAAGALIGLAAAWFCMKHYRLFGRLVPDAAYVVLLALLLPPARLAGFLVGACGGSVRGILNRS